MCLVGLILAIGVASMWGLSFYVLYSWMKDQSVSSAKSGKPYAKVDVGETKYVQMKRRLHELIPNVLT